ncbi:MAG TPA: type II toxin-antitoxin system Phd/YefM family antitoxin [Chthoniobacterales bacterium]
MTQVTIHEAKTQLSRLIQKALAGEEVIIANRDKPVVRLAVIATEKPKRRLGGLAREFGGFSWREWKQMDREIEKDFYRDDPNVPLRSRKP